MTNYEKIKELVDRNDSYLLATLILSIADNDCSICPRSEGEKGECNEDCQSGLSDWLNVEYNKEESVWFLGMDY